MTKKNREIITLWDDTRADFRYYLKVNGSFNSMHSGDRIWAERQAAHYGIKIQEYKEEEYAEEEK